MLLIVPLSFAQDSGSSPSSGFHSERLYGLSAWFVALDGILAGSTVEDSPDAGYKAWVKWSPGSKLPSLSDPSALPDLAALLDPTALLDPSLVPSAGPSMIYRDAARQALDELAMISFGISSRDDGLIHLSELPVFVSAAAALVESQAIDTLAIAAELHGGANPLRVLLAFLSTLNARDREAFRLLAGIKLDEVFRLLDFSRLRGQAQDPLDYRLVDSGPDSASQTGTPLSLALGPQNNMALDTRQMPAAANQADLLAAERLLVSWRSSRWRSFEFQPGSLSHAVARSEAGKYLAGLLATENGSLLFNPGWAGERYAGDAKKDLSQAWAAIGRAVAIDLRREAAPWLARRLGTSSIPSFSLDYTVRPSPSNEYLALITIRSVVSGVSYGIPYQIAARALASASALYFEDAPAPLRYVEEPLPGLRIYVARDTADAGRAIAEFAADLSAAYPAALRVPSLLLHFPAHVEASCEEVCIAMDGAYREAAIGAMLARSFTALLHGRGYPGLDSLIHRRTQISMEDKSGKNSAHGLPASTEKGGID